MRGEWIVHICKREMWQAAQEQGEYRAASLESEGFIHCSGPEQVLDVANHFYRGETGLLLLWIQPELVQAEIRWESVENEGTFPHIHGPLNLSAIRKVTSLIPDEHGIFRNIGGSV